MIHKQQDTIQVQHKGKTHTVVTLRCSICRRIIPVQTTKPGTFVLTEVPCGAGDPGLRRQNGYEPTHVTCIDRAGGYAG